MIECVGAWWNLLYYTMGADCAFSPFLNYKISVFSPFSHFFFNIFVQLKNDLNLRQTVFYCDVTNGLSEFSFSDLVARFWDIL